MIDARLALAEIDPAALLRDFLAALDGGQGAVVSFIGLTRDLGAGGQAVEALFLDHHPRLSEASLQAIADDAAARFAVGALAIVHRAGTVAAGDAVVWVAAASAHRRAAFDAADYMIDRLKTDAMLWKREEGAAGTTWIEPSDCDRAAAARWRKGS